MYQIEMKAGGQTFEFSRASGIFPASLKGIVSPDQTVTLASSSQLDGGYVQATRVEKRTLTLTLQPIRRDAWLTFKKKMTRLLIPHEPAELRIAHNGLTRSVSGYVTGQIEVDSGGAWANKRIMMTIICPQPYLLDDADQEILFRQVAPLWAFPLAFFGEAGAATGMMVTHDSRYLVNNGVAEIGIRAELEAYAGEVVNPWVSDGVRKVSVLAEMNAGDKIVISTVPGEKFVKRNGENYMFFDRTSEFFSVPVGISEITVGADEGLDNLRSKVFYRRKYAGI